ncbi:MAG: P-loop NTPase [Oscillospiraceae bacterium]|nr:P-loop NTPase [Oscillospiraceae bacterium]
MSEILMVTSGKGGVGKTTVSLLLAKQLCRQDKDVLLLELDSGLRGLDILLGVSDKVVYDLSDVLTGRCKPVNAITVCDVPKGNLHLIPAPNDRRFIPERDSLFSLLKGLSGCYDYLILDCAAGLGKGFDIAKSVCTGALIVTVPDPVSIRDAAKAATELRDVPTRLVINKFSRKAISKDLPDIDSMIDAVGVQLISVIAADSLVQLQFAKGVALPQSSPVFRETEDLARRIIGERVKLNTDRLK